MTTLSKEQQLRKPLLSALFTLLLLPPVGVAEAADDKVTKNHENFKGVDTYFSTTFRMGAGDCSGTSKILNSQYRFHRDRSDRFVKVTEFRLVQKFAYSCAGKLLDHQATYSHAGCFGCNGSAADWSRTYSYSPGWPYQRSGFTSVQHARLKVKVTAAANSSEVSLGSFCRATSKFGGDPCS